ncbi:hypothetical protein [Rathayibacter toxicus]|uniref:Uncharacterized protein n=1 Tax=Rathayibacter toxicus TaxID=145458 RepID=A0A2S5Y529_9MICO|nr:hypothetical protein [Rathayibacter toxicus]PPH21688.1 hypothetical protein C5D17_09060 [Rathayibacter toxicus]PPH56117.1 hypothetical protein C5D30_09050 [Rathayibacter toxicus]PPH58213.1 hypothetical protein C5C93_09100 [Rathayibacter toxicus]PPH85959.1 hypothetical protein C5D31_09080 [Rathayibacter toxicus]PPI13843.1 hypothetical protein C5C51_09025 [Rathayibacter toxicus]
MSRDLRFISDPNEPDPVMRVIRDASAVFSLNGHVPDVDEIRDELKKAGISSPTDAELRRVSDSISLINESPVISDDSRLSVRDKSLVLVSPAELIKGWVDGTLSRDDLVLALAGWDHLAMIAEAVAVDERADSFPPGSWVEVTDAFETGTLDANLYKEVQSERDSQWALSDAVVAEDARRRHMADELTRWAEEMPEFGPDTVVLRGEESRPALLERLDEVRTQAQQSSKGSSSGLSDEDETLYWRLAEAAERGELHPPMGPLRKAEPGKGVVCSSRVEFPRKCSTGCTRRPANGADYIRMVR